MRRSITFAGSDMSEAPRLLLGIEEPELYQHPPQAQHLADVLARLSEGNAQVFACTHSPYFVSGKGFEDVRLVRISSPSDGAVISALKFAELSAYLSRVIGEARFKKPEGIRAKLQQVLQPALREMFFAPRIVLVEGIEDVAYITCALNYLGLPPPDPFDRQPNPNLRQQLLRQEALSGKTGRSRSNRSSVLLWVESHHGAEHREGIH
jgi:predicted ATP-dependent endonuclease of OLD family